VPPGQAKKYRDDDDHKKYRDDDDHRKYRDYDDHHMPPGQAKKRWEYGRPLPNDVYYEPLPPTLLSQLSPAPAGYQYVRVANDILMMAVGTRLIAGSVADLSSF